MMSVFKHFCWAIAEVESYILLFYLFGTPFEDFYLKLKDRIRSYFKPLDTVYSLGEERAEKYKEEFRIEYWSSETKEYYYVCEICGFKFYAKARLFRPKCPRCFTKLEYVVEKERGKPDELLPTYW